MLVDLDEFDKERLIKSLERIKKLLNVSVNDLVERVIPGLFEGVSRVELMTLASETAASMATRHPDYSVLAARIACRSLYKTTPHKFSDAMAILFEGGSVTEEVARVAPRVDKYIRHDRDDEFTFIGFTTLCKSYLIRKDRKIVERPQHLFMRVAVGIHSSDIKRVVETYDMMSKRYFVHATPTLFNSGTPHCQFSSCFLTAMKEDSIEGIFETLKDCAVISKYSGGIGLHVSNIRAENAPIKSSGVSSGLVPMLRVYNNMARYVDQGGNKRPGAISITLEPWHADILKFLELRQNHGKEEYRARDLFYALWIPDLFMQKIKENKTWYLFSPDTAPGLSDVYGEEFDALYNSYVDEGLYMASYPAQSIWSAIMRAQSETGNPSILYKDACNSKSNQKNLGTIKSSNLCTEIIEYSSPTQTAVCNLASIALPQFVQEGKFNLELLHKVTKVAAANLDKIIDLNLYPIKSARASNMGNRPMGIGVQGLADVYMALGLAFESAEATQLNKQIFEAIYHAAIETSMELAKEHGPYDSYQGSPASQGILQYDLWNVRVGDEVWDWTGLKKQIKEHGLRNSLVTALMPTATTSQIMGCSECFEPVTSNIFSRRVLSGEFQVVNKYLVSELERLNLWDDKMRQRIMADQGSVQRISEIPDEVKAVFKTVWEIKQRNVIDQSADRGPFIDQSQSLNIFLANPTERQLTSMHFYGWSRGLKTGTYYLRSRAASMPTPFTLEPGLVRSSVKRSIFMGSPISVGTDKRFKSEIDLESCDMCSS